MGFEQGQLIVDHEDLVYHTGQEVTGKLVFNQEKVKKFRAPIKKSFELNIENYVHLTVDTLKDGDEGLYVKMKGYCEVKWVTHHTRTIHKRTRHYAVTHSSHETYFKQKVFLKGGEDGQVHLQPGHHEFPFRCMIPLNCPSSFESSNGHIRYEIKAVVGRAFKFDQEKCRAIRVINQRNLNLDPYCKTPLHFEFQDTYYCWCLRAGMCEMTVRMPQAGYCPGQTINIDVSCANKSSVQIDIIKLELIEHTKFIATSHPDTLEESHSIAKLKKGPIPGNTTRNWTIKMDIPLFDLYNVDTCRYIDIHHTFEVTLSPSGWHSDTDDSRRIVLGHIPLREFGAPSSQGDMIVQPVAPSMSQFPYQQHQKGNPFPGDKIPITSPPYPSANVPYSDKDPPPYPGVNPGYPVVSPPYPGMDPPNSVMNPPYPVVNPPYPDVNPPYPMPGMDAVAAPALPPNANLPFPQNSPMVSNPYALATAPVLSTTDVDSEQKI